MTEEATTARPLAGAPTDEASRIESLDVLRGFALLGILLLNVIGFGLLSPSYSNPGFDVSVDDPANLYTWASVELFAEGAMRCLFSILFGAGVVLFASRRERPAWLHYKRTFWLFAFGLFDAYILLWNGDILITYALASVMLYWIRNWRVRSLLILAAALLLAITAFYAFMNFGLRFSYEAAQQVSAASDPDSLPSGTRSAAAGWNSFVVDFEPPAEEVAAELAARTGSYVDAFRWNAGKVWGMLTLVIPMFMLWDSLVMMIIGMALFKAGVLQGKRSRTFYRRLAFFGFGFGLAINLFEVTRAVRSELDLFTTFAQMQPTYHFGRLGMALGYLAFVVGVGHSLWPWLRARLAAVGRTALSNYLLQSILGALIFTGVGLSLLGRVERVHLYPIVLAIWILQLGISWWWMQRFLYGPAEWLWRFLTYGRRPPMRRASGRS